jgi:hypothetical protein
MKRTGLAWVLIPLAALTLVSSAVAQKPQPPDSDGAILCMRSINTAEVYYSEIHKKGYSPTFDVSHNSGGDEPKTSMAAVILNDYFYLTLTIGKKAGYVVVYKGGQPDADGRINTYTVVARPEKWEKGLLNIFTDETGKIRGTRENRAPTAQDELL